MKTVVVLLDDRKILENVENETFNNQEEFIDRLREEGMDEEMEDTLGYYLITDFMDLVNDQELDDLTGTFIGYVTILK